MKSVPIGKVLKPVYAGRGIVGERLSICCPAASTLLVVGHRPCRSYVKPRMKPLREESVAETWRETAFK